MTWMIELEVSSGMLLKPDIEPIWLFLETKKKSSPLGRVKVLVLKKDVFRAEFCYIYVMKDIAIFLLILTSSACGGGGAETPVRIP